jgi:hypothetical protein
MIVGILSDSHGDAAATEQAVALLESRGAAALFHCGDVCGTSVLDALAGRRAWFVWGNCDDASASMRAYVQALGLEWPRPPVRVTLEGRRIALCHGHEKFFPSLLAARDLDYVFFGHTHAYEDRGGRPRAVNPGALFRARVKTAAVLDLATDALTFLTLEGRAIRARG